MTDHSPTPARSRRQFLVAGGASVLGAATLAACGGSTVVDTSGSIASTSVAPTAPPTTASKADIEAGRSIIRTATSLEHSLAAFYATFTAAAYLDAEAKTWGAIIQGNHEANASALEDLTRVAGGKAFTGPNAFVDKELIAPSLKLANSLKSSDKLIELATQLEQTATATDTLAVSSIALGNLRQGIMAVGATNSRQAYLWRLFAKPGSFTDALPDALISLRDALPAAASVDAADKN